jgi:hypothetical protein
MTTLATIAGTFGPLTRCEQRCPRSCRRFAYAGCAARHQRDLALNLPRHFHSLPIIERLPDHRRPLIRHCDVKHT